MGILSKLFSSKAKGPALTAGPEVRDLPSSPARDILIRIYNGPTKEDERISWALAMMPASGQWSQAEKAFYEYIIGHAIGNRSQGKDMRRIPFFAASVLNNPIRSNLAWHELWLIPETKELASPSAENAVALCRKYPLPDSFDDLLEPWVPEDGEAKPHIFTTWDDAGKNKFLSHQGALLGDMLKCGFITREQHQQLLADLTKKLQI